MIFALLLTMGLDMSLPEFEPVDISGNYIVGSYDVSSDDFIVEAVPSDSVVIMSVSDNNSSDAVVDAIENLNSDNNAYWELFLDSYPIEVAHNANATFVRPASWKFASNGVVTTNNLSSNDQIMYIPVISGITYYITDITSPSFGTYRYGVVNDINNPTFVTNFDSGNVTNYTFTAGQTGYFVMYISYNKTTSFRATWTTIEQDSYTLSELGNAVMTINTKVDMLSVIAYILAFMAFVPFLTKTVDKLMNKKED